MERIIKFRGKRVDNGEWVFGNYIVTLLEPTKSKSKLLSGIQVIEDGIFKSVHIVIPETVGQFTGLTDKNGKEIYEGDIVKCYDNSAKDYSWGIDKEHIGEIVFLDGAFILKCSNGLKKVQGNVDKTIQDYIYLDKWLNAENTEMIGNIHDNAELLK